VLEPDEARRYSLRANIDAQPLRSFTVSLRGSHGAGRLALPLGDAVQQSALYAGLLGNSADDPVRARLPRDRPGKDRDGWRRPAHRALARVSGWSVDAVALADRHGAGRREVVVATSPVR
jgi:hypothetical protein